MALPMLSGGADCGPTNALQILTKRTDADRGLQQDFFGPGRASGSSSQTFRSSKLGTGTPGFVNQDAAQFFGKNSNSRGSSAPQSSFFASAAAAAAFDMSALQGTLPQAQIQQGGWAADFLQFAGPQVKPEVKLEQQEGNASIHQKLQRTRPATPGGVMHWTPATSLGLRTGPQFAMNYAPALSQSSATLQTEQIEWEKEFLSQETSLLAPTLQEPQIQPRTQKTVLDQNGRVEEDELARAAGVLVDSVQNEQNPKFRKSQFLGLMRKMRDREIVVEGNKMVNRALASDVDSPGVVLGSRIDVKGKGKGVSPLLMDDVPLEGLAGAKAFTPLVEQLSETLQQSQEDANDAYFRQENEEYVRYWNDMRTAENTSEGEEIIASTAPRTHLDWGAWGELQREWDAFEATSVGIRPVNNYQFQEHNPYLLGEGTTKTRHHSMHAEGQRHTFFENVLELEAAVQRDPTNVDAWYNLGIKQQEAEREQKALQALLRAHELDPSHLPSWLALAVSHTNDGNRGETLHAIRRWVELNGKYGLAVSEYFSRPRELREEDMSMGEKFRDLIGCLIEMARSGGEEIDADIQIALAVLLNTNEDYEKAQDCFRTALAVRPDDWILYNRVGATMANSGRAQEALEYYYKALELNPAYIRARFNLGISCINLRRYEEAAHHILDALMLQDSDSVRDPNGLNDGRGITSRALWDSLKTTCLHMQRVDLATLCDRKDLEEFRSSFQARMG